ncbi:MAG: MoaD/ThiS family protein [Nitrososphaeria archaeon]
MNVVFVGYLKKVFGKDEIQIRDHLINISELIRYLNTVKIDNEITIKRENTLFLVNEIEISALDGVKTKLNEHDIVTLVPVTHGG